MGREKIKDKNILNGDRLQDTETGIVIKGKGKENRILSPKKLKSNGCKFNLILCFLLKKAIIWLFKISSRNKGKRISDDQCTWEVIKD